MAIRAGVNFDYNGKKISVKICPTIESPLDIILYIFLWPIPIVLLIGTTTGELAVNNRILTRLRWNFAKTKTLSGKLDDDSLEVRLNIFDRNAELMINGQIIEMKPFLHL